jgi:nitrate reductase NapAB chaperone NapD
MVTVGVLVRAEFEELRLVENRLAKLSSVSQTIELEEPGALGLVLQGDSLDAVHAALTEEVQRTEGVLTAWPLHAELDDSPGAASGPQYRTSSDPDPSTEPPKGS